MKYCVECGAKLHPKELKGEGLIPYCDTCAAFRFPIFSTACIMVVFSPDLSRILLIRQYGRPAFILVAGYVNKGESAEAAVAREVMEEVGLTVTRCLYNRSEYFEKSNTLMLNFACVASDTDLGGMTAEVDHAAWFSLDEAKRTILPGSLAERFLNECIERFA